MNQKLRQLIISWLITWLICTPGSAQALAKQVNEFRVEKGTLTAALQNLQRQTKVNVIYDANDLRDKAVEASTFSNQSVGEIIDQLIAGKNLVAEEKQGVIVIHTKAAKTNVSEGTIRSNATDVQGRVVDGETKEGLAGVNVVVKGTVTGTVTDRDGKFALSNIKESDVLVFSMIGYESSEITVGAQTFLEVLLNSDVEMLSDVVVIGYGETNRSELTSSISSVSPKEFNRGVVGSPDQLLNGKVAGLTITRNGDPNGNPTILLRGASTLRQGEAQEPFYVIDGVPGASIRLVSPDDIVSIDVLKDVAATAIYGNRAANGVIMITTRKAKPKYGLTYNGYVGIENVSNKIDVMTGDELRDYLKRNGRALDDRNNDYTAVAGQDTTWTNTDWQDAIMRTGISQNHTLTYGGGTEKASFNASVNYFKNEGIVKNSSSERLITKLSLEQKVINDRLTMNFQVTNSLQKQNLIQEGVFRQMVSYLPTVNIYNDDESFKEETVVHTSNYYNPLGILKLNPWDQKINTFLAHGHLQFDLLENLQFHVNGSIQNESTTGSLYQNSKSIYPISYARVSPFADPPVFSGQAVGGLGKRYSVTNTRQVLETYFQYNPIRTNTHDLKIMGGYSYQFDENNDGFQSTNAGFVSDATGANNLAFGLSTASVDYGSYIIEPLRLISLYSRVNYSLHNKYLIQASIRRDGSSAFVGSNRWGNTPAASAAWLVHRESFMEGLSTVNALKLRVGYGQTGNSKGFDPLYSVYRFGPAGNFYANGGYTTAIGSVSNFNPNLKWETTSMLNVGLDFGLFNNKVSGTVEWYDKDTKDLISNANVSSALFVWNEMTANFGAMNNRGVEITLNATPVVANKFRWDLTAVWAHNKNKITKLSNNLYSMDSIATAAGSGAGVSGVYTQIIKEGYPLGTYKLYKYAGRDENGVSTFLTPDGRTTAEPKFPADAHIMGNAQPKFTYGLNNSFAYGNWSLNIFLRGVYGNDILNSTRAILSSISQAHIRNIPQSAADEPMTDVRNNEYSDRYLEKGSYLRLDNATLGYTIPFTGDYIRSARVYVTGQNLFVITDYSGIDPEVNLGSLTPGFDNNNFYPRTRSFLLGVTLDF